MNDFEGDRTIFIAAFVAYVAYLNILILIECNKNLILEANVEANFERKRACDRLMNDIRNHKDSRDIIRVRPHVFQRLCFILRGTGRLRDNQYSRVEEKVAKFLHVLSHNVRNRTIRFFFQRSLGTISSHFHNILRALISLEDRFLVQPMDDFPIPNETLMKKDKFYPYFEVIDLISKVKTAKFHVKITSQFGDKKIHNLELLRDIYEKDRGTGTKARTAKERLRQWEETNTIEELDHLQTENVIILENLEDPHTSPELGNSNGASFKKTLKKSSSKLSVKRKFEDINSEDKRDKNSTDPIQEGLKNVNESMAEIARALHAANARMNKSVIRIYSATEIYDELEKHEVPDDKLLDAAIFLKTNNENADTFFCCPERLKRQWL